MKLIYCNECHDVFRLFKNSRTCQCGESGGHYKEDGLYAVIHGNCLPLGFTNSTFMKARDEQPEFGAGSLFTSFVIPVVCPTIDHVDSKDYVYHIHQQHDILKDGPKKTMRNNGKLKNVFKDEK